MIVGDASRSKGWLWLVAVLVAAGCATSGGAAGDGDGAEGTAEPPEDVNGCDMAEADFAPKACSGVADDYGYTKEQPLEYGKSGGIEAAGLGFGRLTCPDGGRAETIRLGNVGRAPVESDSPGATDDPMDVLDLWLVVCPSSSEVFEVYHNMYRCGSPCPPKPLTWRPTEANEMFEEAYSHLNEERKKAALEAGRALFETYPELNDSLTVYASALMLNGKAQKLRSVLEQRCRDKDDGNACLWLGTLHNQGTGGPEQSKAARSVFGRSCELGDARGCFELGKMESMGAGGATDNSAAREHFVEACRGGVGEPCAVAASMVEKGMGGPADAEEAKALLKQGCQVRSEKACQRLEAMKDEAEGSKQGK